MRISDNCNFPEGNDTVGKVLPSGDIIQGEGNFYDPPLLDAENGYRLRHDSPCKDAGMILPWMAGARDLDGNPRVDRVSGRVDLGPYEYTYSATLFMVR